MRKWLHLVLFIAGLCIFSGGMLVAMEFAYGGSSLSNDLEGLFCSIGVVLFILLGGFIAIYNASEFINFGKTKYK